MSLGATDDRQKALFEQEISRNVSNFEAVHFLGVWHMERQSYLQARQYFIHLTTLQPTDPHLYVCLSICCGMCGDIAEYQNAFVMASKYFTNAEDVRVLFCMAFCAELKKDFAVAYERYRKCIMKCDQEIHQNSPLPDQFHLGSPYGSYMEIRGEALLRLAVVRKDTGAHDVALQMCDQICAEVASTHLISTLGTSALCLKGLLHEMRGEFPTAEVVYRSAIQIVPGHALALERLGRVYLRYRETIPAAVQCFFKAVETCSSNHIAWYLLGRCYSATGQYTDAREAYNRAVNINPNDANVWCSLGVLYYASGQYRESLGMLSRAVKLNPKMADAWHNIGTLYEICGQIEDSQLAYEQARRNGLVEAEHRSEIAGNSTGLVMSSDGVLHSDGGHGSAESDHAVLASTSENRQESQHDEAVTFDINLNSIMQQHAPQPAVQQESILTTYV